MDGQISAADLRELLEAGDDVRVVDVRSASAFRRGHIPNSVNVPFAELTDRIEEVADAERVVTVCPHGEASKQAARLIGAFEGFTGRVDSLEPGIDGWPYDLETGEPTPSAGPVGETPDEGSEAPF